MEEEHKEENTAENADEVKEEFHHVEQKREEPRERKEFNFGEFYDKRYKLILLIPLLVLVGSLVYLGGFLNQINIPCFFTFLNLQLFL